MPARHAARSVPRRADRTRLTRGGALVGKLGAERVDQLGRQLPPRDRPRIVAPEQAGDPDQRLRLRPTATRREPGHVALGR